MFKKSLSFILISSLLLLGCDFRPNHKVIKYQEEVKLSDGSFIWVDIKRHYRLAGEPFQKANYLPDIVEISWDTGFEGVGRKTMTSDVGNSSAIYTLDKIGEFWYVALKVNHSSEFSHYGNEIKYSIMVYILDEDGNFVKTQNIPILYRNIMYYDIDKELSVKKKITKFTWQDKLNALNNKGLSVGYQLHPIYEKTRGTINE